MIRLIIIIIYTMSFFNSYSQLYNKYSIEKGNYLDIVNVSEDSIFSYLDSALLKPTWVKFLQIDGGRKQNRMFFTSASIPYPQLKLDSIFCQMFNLKYLVITKFNINEVSECFSYLDNLEYLIIGLAKFDTLPTPITHLKNLEYLDLNNGEKNFKGIGNLKNLNHLHMGVIDSNCKDVSELFKLTKIKYLDVIVPNLPNGISKLKELEYLDITTPNVSKDLGKLSKLNYLKISKINMSHIPNTFYKFKTLEHLLINQCDFVNDTFPKVFYKFKNLRNMTIYFNNSQIKVPELFKKKAKEVYSDYDEY